MVKMTPNLARTLSIAEQHEWFEQQRTRRTMLRGGLVGAGALVAGPTLLGGAARAAARPAQRQTPSFLRSGDRPGGALVTPFGRHISYGVDPTSTMNIAWQVPAAVSKPFVRIGISPDNLSHKIPADLENLSTPYADITSFVDAVPPAIAAAAAPDEQYYVHAKLKGLRPGTNYFYSVGHDGWDRGSCQLGTTLGSFQTAPTRPGAFRFTAFGDQGSTYDAIADANLVLAKQPAFHLHAGDISYAENGGAGLITDAYDPRVWDSYFVAIAQTAAQIPWMFSLGNHEMEPWYSPNGYGADVLRMDFPGNGPSVSPGSYSFRYGNVAVISLDPNDVSDEIPANNGFTGGVQTTWLDHTLGQLRGDRSIDFIAVFFHHCAYCTCAAHGSEGGVRQLWAPLFDKHSVDLVINGHNHIYERTDPIKAGVATRTSSIGDTITPATQGTTYVTAGGAGKSLYSFDSPDSYEGNVDNLPSVPGFVNLAGGTTQDETVTWSRVRYTGYNLLVVDVKPGIGRSASTMTVSAVNNAGTEVDTFTLKR